MPKWLLPTLSEVVALSDTAEMGSGCRRANGVSPHLASNGHRTAAQGEPSPALRQLRAEREWAGAIAALDGLLEHYLTHDNTVHTINLNTSASQHGFVLAGPSPVLSAPVVQQLSTWTVAAPSGHAPNWLGFQLLPAGGAAPVTNLVNPVLPLLPGDPLASEPFCLVFTPWFSLIMVLGEDLQGDPAFLFSFSPEVVQRSWEAVRPRILLMSSHQVDFLDELAAQFPPVTPDFKMIMQFSRLMLSHLPEPVMEASKASQEPVEPLWEEVDNAYGAVETSNFDVELVKAIAHEVRTPLTTIRTLTRSLLKRSDLPADVLRRLGIIDRECSEQIDRFGLIFKAVEIESSTTHAASMSLIRTSLGDVFQQSIPRWQQQASQRQMTLTVDLPQEMPAVVSDPTVLDQALTSLIERFTRNLPAGSHIQVEVTPAGSQLKVQLQSQLDAASNGKETNPFSSWKNSAKSIGQMLMFQPETGNLSLNLAVTKNLFQAIGGKLIVKQRPQQGEVMTVYLPLEVGDISLLDSKKIITI